MLEFLACHLKHFNPNYLPSSLKILTLPWNEIQAFELTRSLVNLEELDLFGNSLTSFVLDLQQFLPNIKSVNLSRNTIRDLQVIDDKSHHPLVMLNLDENRIRNHEAYEWIFQNQNKTSFEGSIPVCDCNSKKMLDKFYDENFVDNCTLPLPEDVRVNILNFPCPAVDLRDNCSYFNGLYKRFLFFTEK